ncbi:MAG: hypothetical protein COV52_03380 [Gammaproteobacteria bacterium CG11_big_fil_rev_8_21_14_0_20_46_22]|nr:MAG: hypothetical protein COW05_09645 [Gammaproteobacteria bacterium CG12_big_fil_rev_8_21_14_0_65_46_12]PIR11515.1 MAG: hypothetical protein COV52_03380 [Gammaproteobacteria bacterium CG11_big_fil_rev_8_21_14_0_20_46_22]
MGRRGQPSAETARRDLDDFDSLIALNQHLGSQVVSRYYDEGLSSEMQLPAVRINILRPAFRLYAGLYRSRQTPEQVVPSLIPESATAGFRVQQESFVNDFNGVIQDVKMAFSKAEQGMFFWAITQFERCVNDLDFSQAELPDEKVKIKEQIKVSLQMLKVSQPESFLIQQFEKLKEPNDAASLAKYQLEFSKLKFKLEHKTLQVECGTLFDEAHSQAKKIICDSSLTAAQKLEELREVRKNLFLRLSTKCSELIIHGETLLCDQRLMLPEKKFIRSVRGYFLQRHKTVPPEKVLAEAFAQHCKTALEPGRFSENLGEEKLTALGEKLGREASASLEAEQPAERPAPARRPTLLESDVFAVVLYETSNFRERLAEAEAKREQSHAPGIGEADDGAQPAAVAVASVERVSGAGTAEIHPGTSDSLGTDEYSLIWDDLEKKLEPIFGALAVSPLWKELSSVRLPTDYEECAGLCKFLAYNVIERPPLESAGLELTDHENIYRVIIALLPNKRNLVDFQTSLRELFSIENGRKRYQAAQNWLDSHPRFCVNGTNEVKSAGVAFLAASLCESPEAVLKYLETNPGRLLEVSSWSPDILANLNKLESQVPAEVFVDAHAPGTAETHPETLLPRVAHPIPKRPQVFVDDDGHPIVGSTEALLFSDRGLSPAFDDQSDLSARSLSSASVGSIPPNPLLSPAPLTSEDASYNFASLIKALQSIESFGQLNLNPQAGSFTRELCYGRVKLHVFGDSHHQAQARELCDRLIDQPSSRKLRQKLALHLFGCGITTNNLQTCFNDLNDDIRLAAKPLSRTLSALEASNAKVLARVKKQQSAIQKRNERVFATLAFEGEIGQAYRDQFTHLHDQAYLDERITAVRAATNLSPHAVGRDVSKTLSVANKQLRAGLASLKRAQRHRLSALKKVLQSGASWDTFTSDDRNLDVKVNSFNNDGDPIGLTRTASPLVAKLQVLQNALVLLSAEKLKATLTPESQLEYAQEPLRPTLPCGLLTKADLFALFGAQKDSKRSPLYGFYHSFRRLLASKKALSDEQKALMAAFLTVDETTLDPVLKQEVGDVKNLFLGKVLVIRQNNEAKLEVVAGSPEKSGATGELAAHGGGNFPTPASDRAHAGAAARSGAATPAKRSLNLTGQPAAPANKTKLECLSEDYNDIQNQVKSIQALGKQLSQNYVAADQLYLEEGYTDAVRALDNSLVVAHSQFDAVLSAARSNLDQFKQRCTDYGGKKEQLQTIEVYLKTLPVEQAELAQAGVTVRSRDECIERSSLALKALESTGRTSDRMEVFRTYVTQDQSRLAPTAQELPTLTDEQRAEFWLQQIEAYFLFSRVPEGEAVAPEVQWLLAHFIKSDPRCCQYFEQYHPCKGISSLWNWYQPPHAPGIGEADGAQPVVAVASVERVAGAGMAETYPETGDSLSSKPVAADENFRATLDRNPVIFAAWLSMDEKDVKWHERLLALKKTDVNLFNKVVAHFRQLDSNAADTLDSFETFELAGNMLSAKNPRDMADLFELSHFRAMRNRNIGLTNKLMSAFSHFQYDTKKPVHSNLVTLIALTGAFGNRVPEEFPEKSVARAILVKLDDIKSTRAGTDIVSIAMDFFTKRNGADLAIYSRALDGFIYYGLGRNGATRVKGDALDRFCSQYVRLPMAPIHISAQAELFRNNPELWGEFDGHHLGQAALRAKSKNPQICAALRNATVREDVDAAANNFSFELAQLAIFGLSSEWAQAHQRVSEVGRFQGFDAVARRESTVQAYFDRMAEAIRPVLLERLQTDLHRLLQNNSSALDLAMKYGISPEFFGCPNWKSRSLKVEVFSKYLAYLQEVISTQPLQELRPRLISFEVFLQKDSEELNLPIDQWRKEERLMKIYRMCPRTEDLDTDLQSVDTLDEGSCNQFLEKVSVSLEQFVQNLEKSQRGSNAVLELMRKWVTVDNTLYPRERIASRATCLAIYENVVKPWRVFLDQAINNGLLNADLPSKSMEVSMIKLREQPSVSRSPSNVAASPGAHQRPTSPSSTSPFAAGSGASSPRSPQSASPSSSPPPRR